MNFPVAKKDLLRQPGAAVNVQEDRYGVPDKMTVHGDRKAQTQLAGATAHPLQAVEDARPLESIRQELAMAKRMFGSQLAQQLAFEMQACAQVGRFQSPIPSSLCMLNTLLGLDDVITVEDTFKSVDNIETMVDVSPMANLKIQ